MFDLMKDLRWLKWVVSIALVVAGLTLYLIQTSPVRRLVLTRIQAYVRQNQGLALQVGDFDFSLLSSKLEFKDVVLNDLPAQAQTASLMARHVVVMIPAWRLALGSLDSAQIWIDGLVVNWTTPDYRATNPSAMNRAKDGGMPRLPAISAVNCELNLHDRRSGASLHLPNGRLSVAWNPARNEQSITFGGSSGYVRWNQARLALDQVDLTSALASSGFSLSSLLVVSGASKAEISGTVSGSPARIEARGTLDFDLHKLSRSLGSTEPVDGRLKAELSATGPVQGLQVKGQFSSDRLTVRGTPVTNATVAATLDTATGQLQISDLSAEVFSGHLTGYGRAGQSESASEFSARLTRIEPRQVAQSFASVIPDVARASMEVSASWPGLDWRRVSLAGSARSLSAKMSFRADSDPKSIRASLQAALGDGATTRGDIAVTFPSHALSGKFTGNMASVQAVTRDAQQFLQRKPDNPLEQPVMDGAAGWSATLGGTLEHPSASVQAAVNGLSIGNWKNADVELDANLAADAVEIRRARLHWSGQKIEINGRVGGLSADAPLQLNGKVGGSSFGAVFENLGLARLSEGSVSGAVQIGGTVGRPAVETTLNLDDLTLLGVRFARTRVDAQWQNSELKISRFQAEHDAESGTPGQLNAGGSLDFSTRQYAINMTGQGLRPTSESTPHLAGTFSLEAHGTGTLDNPTLSARVTGSDVRIGEVILGELRGEAEARDHRASGIVTAPALNARAASNIIMEHDWPFELNLDAENTRLNTNPASSFDASVRGAGSLAGGLDQMTAVIRDLRLATPGQDTITDGPVQISIADRHLRVERLALTSGDSNLNVTGSIPLFEGGASGSLALQGHVGLDRISSFFPEMPTSKVRGVAEVSATLTGSGQHWTPMGSITIKDGGFRTQSIPLGIENLAGRFSIEDAIIRTEEISGTLGTGRFSIAGSLPLRLFSTALPVPKTDARQPARLSAHLDDLGFTSGSDGKQTTASVGLKIAAEASTLNLDALLATIDFSELRLQTAKSDLRQTTPTRISIAGGIARLESLTAKGPDASLSVSGSIGLKGEQRLEVDATADMRLAALGGLIAPLETAGRLQLEAHGAGTLIEPRITGSVILQQTSISLQDPLLQATEVNLKATLAGEEIRIGEFSGMLNGGSFTGGGDLKFKRGDLVGSSLQVSAKDVYLEYPAGLKTTSSLALKLALRNNRPALEGQVEIQDGYWDAPLELFGSSQNLEETNMGTQARAGSSPMLDVQIVSKRPVEMDNNFGRLAAVANLRLAGTVAQPRVLGNVQLEQDGRIYFGDRTYYIERGTVRFLDSPKPAPEFDIHASTRAGSYTVNLGLTGQPEGTYNHLHFRSAVVER